MCNVVAGDGVTCAVALALFSGALLLRNTTAHRPPGAYCKPLWMLKTRSTNVPCSAQTLSPSLFLA